MLRFSVKKSFPGTKSTCEAIDWRKTSEKPYEPLTSVCFSLARYGKTYTRKRHNLMAKVDTCKELQKYLALKISSLTIAMNFRHWPYWVSIDNIFSFHWSKFLHFEDFLFILTFPKSHYLLPGYFWINSSFAVGNM